MRLVTADDLCVAVQASLAAGLPPLVTALGLDDSEHLAPNEKPYAVPANWTQVPMLEVLQAAVLPAGAVTSTGLTGAPRKSSLGTDATWRIRVGVFDRGADYNQTARRVRTWAALVRAVLVDDPTLGGIASSLEWVGESYRQYAQVNAARTLGGCVVEVDVTARNVVDVQVPDPALPPETPNVQSTSTRVSVR